MLNPERLAVRLAEELARDGHAASPGPPAGDYGWKLRLEGVRGAIVVYTGKKGPRLVLTELQSPPPELEVVIRRAWERVQAARRAPSPRLATRPSAAAGLPDLQTRGPAVSPRPVARPSAAATQRAQASAPSETPAARPSKTTLSTGSVDLWVDGSYVAEGRRSAIGWAVLILGSGRELYRATGTDVPAEARSQRNVAGEILAVRNGLSWCREHGIDRVSVYHDYEGLEAWVTGRWQARNPFTAAYACWVRESGVVVCWQKVRAHSGRARNEQVDRLARQAAMAALTGLSGRDRPAAAQPGRESSSDPEAGARCSPDEGPRRSSE